MTSSTTQTPRTRRTPPPPPPSRTGRRLAIWLVVLVALAAVIGGAMWSARPKTGSSAAGSVLAPTFSLPSTAGATVDLASLRGGNVLIYFNEGAGCDACFYQMVDIEKNKAEFAQRGITVLPMVMNSLADTSGEMARFKLTTPYLVDADGAVSKEYGVLGKGMHAGLPGHSFVLIDSTGVKRWYGEYPSMFLASKDLLKEIDKNL